MNESYSESANKDTSNDPNSNSAPNKFLPGLNQGTFEIEGSPDQTVDPIVAGDIESQNQTAYIDSASKPINAVRKSVPEPSSERDQLSPDTNELSQSQNPPVRSR